MAGPFDTNPAFRKITYRAQWIANGVLAILGAYFAATVDSVNGLPNWYVVALAVLPVLWTYLGVQADTNTSAPSPPKNEGGFARYVAPGGGGLLNALGVLLIVVAVILFLTTVFGVFVVSPVALIVLAIVGIALVLLF